MEITPEFLRDPYPVYQRMRETGRMHLSSANTGRTWFLPHHADIRTALRDERFSASRKAGGFVNQFPAEVRPEFARFNEAISRWIVLHDQPEHRQLRQLMQQGFTRRLITTMEPKIQRVCDDLIDAFVKRGSTEFMTEYAHPFPAKVIAEMLGVNPEDYPAFVVWSEDLLNFAGSLRPTLEMFRAAQDGLLAMMDYFARLLPERRENPGDDLVSLLLSAESEGEWMTAEQVLANCTQIIVAGHETTRNLVANGVELLLRYPEQRALLESRPELMPSAVREIMRFESPLQFIRRVAREDFEFGGAEVREGDGLVLMLGSANRDPEAFDDPDTFDLTRNPTGHLAFGWGPHVCVGAALAELEGQVSFRTLLDRLPGLELRTHEPERIPNPMLRGFASLDLGFRESAG
ncbi:MULTISPECIES: cytochrome P450 [Streptomyces]|uniref:Putative cytochrome P450 hydroxylase n=1 Tax=Streptomyces venezuelae (strain ATCC 10712 / CBS 650.69 / DSM 40230 / JCM 4526 / NBRC 13096 / PD 04745) TaxID=953739 RepID=F2RDK3_STRVP|nr:cytochrome P450 [Streptomyces venezuelae]APE24961.1 cytochrome [Streptomyces venezuelae]QES02306.1 cytochrome P450 [Streptomyces venezuelae ATCC 10712]CCA59495.1 putative cytochrome P450 hydroxylase [Streptomyces venezuelae ATCC 10712]